MFCWYIDIKLILKNIELIFSMHIVGLVSSGKVEEFHCWMNNLGYDLLKNIIMNYIIVIEYFVIWMILLLKNQIGLK